MGCLCFKVNGSWIVTVKKSCIFIIKKFGLLGFVVGFMIVLESVAPPIAKAQVVINEFSSEGSSDWIEIYGDSDTNISGWVLRDTASSPVYTFPENSYIGPSYDSFLDVDVSNRLNNDGDIIKLLESDDSTLVDSISYGDEGGVCAPENGQSVGRFENGNPIERFNTPTRGESNTGAQLAPCPSPTPEPTNTPTPTPKPTSTPVPTNTTKPTIAPTKVSTNTLDNDGDSNDESNEGSMVLGGSREELKEDLNEENDDVSERKIPLAAGAFVVAGIGFIGAAFYPFFKKRRKGYNLEDNAKEEDTDQIL